jgi:hypothetical protein
MSHQKNKFPNLTLPSILLLLSLIFCWGIKVHAQETDPDSLFAAKLMEDNLSLYNQIDSLENVINSLKNYSGSNIGQLDSLQAVSSQSYQKYLTTKHVNDSLLQQLIALNRTLISNKQEILTLTTNLEDKTQQLHDKELLLVRTEAELKELKSSDKINQVKLEGKLDVNATKLQAKDKEIAYLKKSIEDKDRAIREKNTELSAFYHEKDNSLRIIDSLSRALNQKELENIRITERLKVIESQYNEMLAKQNAATNKKKKIRFIQGVGIKSYRTPDWELAPQSSSSSTVLVISNKNAGKMDVDYITGVSLALYDLTQEDSKFTYDAGLFVGFGGQNLFKNFYVGPSFKVFDFFHVNVGANFAEYQQLKPGFKEGDQPGTSGLSSVLVKQWKTNFFIGFTLDLELLSNIPKKM